MCNASLALARLEALDLVCLLPNISQLAAAVARRISIRNHRVPHVLRMARPGGARQVPGPILPNASNSPTAEVEPSQLAEQPAELQRALDCAAECDEGLFALMAAHTIDVRAGCWKG